MTALGRGCVENLGPSAACDVMVSQQAFWPVWVQQPASVALIVPVGALLLLLGRFFPVRWEWPPSAA